MGLRDRWQSFRDRPSRADMMAMIGTLTTELEQKRFKRFNPVPSGVPITYGQYEYEQTEALTGTGKWDQYDRLALDPHVRGSLRSIILPLVKAEWEIEPASEDARDEEIAEFVSANLLRQGGDKYGSDYYLQTPWKAVRLRELLDMLESGFSMFAKSVKIVDGKRVYDRLQWLEPSSVDPRGWDVTETDEIEAVKRTFSTPAGDYRFEDPIEADQLVLYPWDVKGARYEGRALTRPMFGAWMRKEFKQKMSAILAQKLGAPMPYGWWPDGFPMSAIPEFKRAVQAMRGSSAAESFVAGPMGKDGKPPELGYVGAEHNIDRGFMDSITSENQEIRHAGGSASASLGESESGSRALGESKGLTEMDLVEAVAEIVCEFETNGIANLSGPIEELVDWNFAGVKKYPKLTVNKINPFALQNGWEQLVKAWEAGLIPKTPEARRQIVETHLGLNLPDEQYDVEEPPELQPPTDGSGGGSPPEVPGAPPERDEDDNPGRQMEAARDFRKRIAPLLTPVEDAPAGGGFRGRTRLEADVVNLAAVQASFRVGERDFLLVLRETHRLMIEDLMGRLRDGKVTTRNIEGQRRSVFKFAKKARNKVVKVFAAVGADGWQAVDDEIGRQTDAD